MFSSGSNKLNTELCYADSCEKRIGVPYVQEGTSAQVVDIYYADSLLRKDAVLIDIHGGFYVAGKRQNNRAFASEFLKAGFDVVLLEYRVGDGKLDVSTSLTDCAAALDYLTKNASALGLNKDRMFITGDSAGGHLALYMAEGASDTAVPIRPSVFSPRGVMLNCPAYDFASFADKEAFTEEALSWFIGPRWEDNAWLESVSPRTFISSYRGPLFVSTCRNDFIRGQALLIMTDCVAMDYDIEFIDLDTANAKVGHVHNVISPALADSRTVNGKMIDFMLAQL